MGKKRKRGEGRGRKERGRKGKKRKRGGGRGRKEGRKGIFNFTYPKVGCPQIHHFLPTKSSPPHGNTTVDGHGHRALLMGGNWKLAY